MHIYGNSVSFNDGLIPFCYMITIYLARHGQTEENISRIFQGHLPGHLTEEGKQQAVELGKRLRGYSTGCYTEQ